MRSAPSLARRLALTAAALGVSLATASTAAVVQQGNLRITLVSQVQPYKLPRTGTAPIAILVSGHVAPVTGVVPDQLEGLQVRVNRYALLQSRGLPACTIAQIQPATTARALANCGEALIGSGQFWAHIVLPDQGAYPTQGRLLVFNGRASCNASHNSSSTGSNLQRHARTRSGGHAAFIQDLPFADSQSQSDSSWGSGKGPVDHAQGSRRSRPCHHRPTLIAHIFTAHPFATSFVIPFSISRIDSGYYGTELSASLPEALGSWGYVDRIKLTLKRKYQFHGRELSYFNAGCPAVAGASRASFHLAYATFSFANRNIGAQVDKSCGVAE